MNKQDQNCCNTTFCVKNTIIVIIIITLTSLLIYTNIQKKNGISITQKQNIHTVEKINSETPTIIKGSTPFGYRVTTLPTENQTTVSVETQGILSKNPIAFAFSYSQKDYVTIWGIPRMYVIDYTATGGPADIVNLKMLAGFKFEAGNEYSENNFGYVFEIILLNKKAKALTYEDVSGGKYGVYLNETDEYYFVYKTFTNLCLKEKHCTEKDSQKINDAVKKILSTFIVPLK